MFPQVDIVRWRAVAPWADDDDVEQDLVITLALFDIFRDAILKEALAFRGGTALHNGRSAGAVWESLARGPTAGSPTTWPNRPTRIRGPRPAPLRA